MVQSDNIEQEEPDSQPLNFDTFIPTHDPSLPIPMADPSSYIGIPGASIVSQDEAFSRAMTAMYWGGYWTAMYHVCVSSEICFHSSTRSSVNETNQTQLVEKTKIMKARVEARG